MAPSLSTTAATVLLLLPSLAMARLGEPGAAGSDGGSPNSTAAVPVASPPVPPAAAEQAAVSPALEGGVGPTSAEVGLALNETTMSFMSAGLGGYAAWSTTTVYGDSQAGACGGIKTADLTAGTPYYNVASAQSMWLGCKSHGNCMCGKSGGGAGTMGMGCFTCAKGRFLNSAYGMQGGQSFPGFASEEIVVVVGDLCPYDGNQQWCPERPGETNSFGSHNHLDFSHPPKGILNNNFVFTPIACPGDLRQRYLSMAGHCGEA